MYGPSTGYRTRNYYLHPNKAKEGWTPRDTIKVEKAKKIGLKNPTKLIKEDITLYKAITLL